MPNWCYNTLEVRGQPEDVQKFFEHAQSETMEKCVKSYNPLSYESMLIKRDLDFNKFIKMPQELKETKSEFGGTEEEQEERFKKYEANIAKYGYATWYEWAIDNWDTKWNSGEVEYDYDVGDDTLFYRFSTAWSPPMKIFHKMAQMFPSLKFHATYRDEGDAFYGESGWKNSVQLFERDITPSDTTWMDEDSKEEQA